MARELPGYYFDEEKNRYFPIKGPIPGSSRKRKSSSAEEAQSSGAQQNQVYETQNSKNKRSDKLLQYRELSGNLISSSKGILNFQAEYQKKLVSQPLICKYRQTERIAETAMELVNVRINMPEGAVATDLLLTGGLNGSLSLLAVQNIAEEINYGLKCMQDHVWPPNSSQLAEQIEVPQCLWRPLRVSLDFPSSISSIKMCPRSTQYDGPSEIHVLFTTLGSGRSGGALYIWGRREPLSIDTDFLLSYSYREVTSFKNTVWTADCNYDGSQAVIGTNQGAYLVDVEYGTCSHLLRCKSDVLSAQFDHVGHVILCGLRSGEIVTVDGRQKPKDFSSQCRIPSSSRLFVDAKPPRIMYGSRKISMPSSISCLAPLSLYDQYFLASSMDGSIKLYDQRLIQKGAVQSYEGNVNSHSRIQLGVDPSEKVVMSGGEDCKLRLWSIKSGEMLFEGQVMNSVPSIVCWPRPEVMLDPFQQYREKWQKQYGDEPWTRPRVQEQRDHGQKHRGGAWIGSHEGLFYMNWP